MLDFLKKFERLIIGTLIILMMIVVLLSTIELGWIILQDILNPPYIVLDANELLDIFGFFLLVLIGVELIETLRAYLTDNVVHAEVVVEVAMIAIARKVIILDIKELSGLTLVGIAAIIAALTGAFYVLKRMHDAKAQ
jgi:uncharacterized membrane protein (DUF373 family)